MGMKELYAQLSAIQGGSLIAEQRRLWLDAHSRVLFLGLGGLGCRTINILKGMVQRDFENADHVRFLAVDSDRHDLEELSDGRDDAQLSPEECFCIFTPNTREQLFRRPPAVEQWLSRDIPVDPLVNSSPRTIRAVGRALLCGTEMYQALQTQTRALLDALCSGMTDADRLSVVIVSGLSGGTGSGIFVDVSYMVRMLLSELRDFRQVDCEQYGVFYTADVQRSILSIRCDHAYFAQLQRNAYAAMKELDYFVNAGSPAPDEEPIYSLPLPDGSVVQSAEPMFDAGKVFLVNGGDAQECEEILNHTAAGLLNLFRNGLGGTTPLAAFSDSCSDLRDTWCAAHVGKPASSSLPTDPCGIRNTEFPASMNYSFSGLGFRSVWFPKKKLAAWYVNQVIRRVYTEWIEQAERVTDRDAKQLAEKCGFGSFDQIYDSVLRSLSMDTKQFRLSAEEASLRAVGAPSFRIGRYIGIAETMQEADNRAHTLLDQLRSRLSDDTVRPMLNAVKAHLEDPQWLSQHGPFAAETLLSGGHSAPAGGLIGLLERMQNLLGDAGYRYRMELEQATHIMTAEAQRMTDSHSINQGQMEVFLDICGNYSAALVKAGFFEKLMPGVLRGLASALQSYDQETFRAIVPAVQAVSDILTEDAAAFQQNTLERRAVPHAYSVNAFHLDPAESPSFPILEALGREMGMAGAYELARRFADSVLAPGSRGVWTAFRAEEPNSERALAEEIRRLFPRNVSPLPFDILEKYIVLAYADPERLQQLLDQTEERTLRALECGLHAMDYSRVREQAMNRAAENIVRFLTDVKPAVFDVLSETQGEFSRVVSIGLLEETPHLNAAIEKVLNTMYPGGYTITANHPNQKSEITMTTVLCPFPPAMLKGIRESAKAYFESEKMTSYAVGRHLDEVTERWQTYLPELCGEDAEAYYTEFLRNPSMAIPDSSRPVGRDGRPINHERELYEQLRAAVSFGLDHGFIRRGGMQPAANDSYANDYFLALPGEADKESREYRICNDQAFLMDALRETDPEDRERVVSLLCRIIRTSMPMTRRVLELPGSSDHV